MVKKTMKVFLILIIFSSCIFLASCDIPDHYYFQEGVYKCEGVEVILYEDVIITGVSLEFKRIEKAENNINTLKNFKNKREYEVKLNFIINDEEVQCDFINKKRPSNEPDLYWIVGDISHIINIPNATLDLTLEPTRIDDNYSSKDRNSTRIEFWSEYFYVDDEMNNRISCEIDLNLDYVNDENDEIEV